MYLVVQHIGSGDIDTQVETPSFTFNGSLTIR